MAHVGSRLYTVLFVLLLGAAFAIAEGDQRPHDMKNGESRHETAANRNAEFIGPLQRHEMQRKLAASDAQCNELRQGQIRPSNCMPISSARQYREARATAALPRPSRNERPSSPSVESQAPKTVPRSPAPQLRMSPGQTSGRVYMVKSGDSCTAIATRHGMQIPHLRRMNPAINPECTNLRPGQILNVEPTVYPQAESSVEPPSLPDEDCPTCSAAKKSAQAVRKSSMVSAVLKFVLFLLVVVVVAAMCCLLWLPEAGPTKPLMALPICGSSCGGSSSTGATVVRSVTRNLAVGGGMLMRRLRRSAADVFGKHSLD